MLPTYKWPSSCASRRRPSRVSPSRSRARRSSRPTSTTTSTATRARANPPPTLQSGSSCLKATTTKKKKSAPPKLTSLRPEGMPLLSEKEVEAVVLNTQIVKEKLKVEKQQKQDDTKTYERLTALANQYEKYQPNHSLGAKKGVDAAVIDGGEVDDDEWDD
mmetsp:Transcript_6144/g.20041  ORF Transcript_6144/g.20041 Transcript_6144/m.20041 type:complete len:161 (-) Transcript_6144:267-749(-)